MDRSRRSRRTASALAPAFALAVLLGLTTAPPSHGQALTLRHGLDGHHRPGLPVPVYVELSNNSDRTRRLTLASDFAERPARRAVTLNPGTRKTLVFYLPHADESRGALLSVLDEDGLPIQEMDLASQPVPSRRPLVGLLSRGSLGWSRLRRDEAVALAHIDARWLPDLHQGLLALDLVVWPDPRPEDLTAEQVEALALWTEAGGTLVLAVNDTWLDASTGSLEAWTRMKPQGLRSVTRLESLERLTDRAFPELDEPISVARLSGPGGDPDRRTWLTEAGAPLASIERRGRGQVVLLGFDPSDGPLARWPGMPRLWQDLLEEVGHPSVEPDTAAGPAAPRHGSGWPYDLQRVAHSRFGEGQGIQPPSIGLLLGILAAYLLLIGPVDYLVLRKMKKLSWTWITYPTLVALFTAGTWAAATHGRSGTALRHAMVVSDLAPESDRWLEEAYTALFVVRGGEVALRHPGPALPVPSPAYIRAPVTFGRQDSLVSDQEEVAVRSRIPKWSMLTARFLRTRPARGARVEAELGFHQGRLTGRIVPHLGFDLEEAYLLLAQADGQGARRFELGPLRDATPRELHGLTWDDVTLDPFRQGSQLLEPVLAQTARRLVTDVAPDEEALQARRQGMDRDPHPHHDWSPALERGAAVLVGVTSHEEKLVEVRGAEARDTGSRRVVRVLIPPEALGSEPAAGARDIPADPSEDPSGETP